LALKFKLKARSPDQIVNDNPNSNGANVFLAVRAVVLPLLRAAFRGSETKSKSDGGRILHLSEEDLQPIALLLPSLLPHSAPARPQAAATRGLRYRWHRRYLRSNLSKVSSHEGEKHSQLELPSWSTVKASEKLLEVAKAKKKATPSSDIFY